MTHGFHSDTRGSSALEFALVMPVLITLLIAAALFGQAFYALGSVQWAIERTARDLMLDGELSTADFETRVRTLTADLTAMDYQVSYSDTIYGEIRVTEITTILNYTMTIPAYGDLTLTYPVRVQSPRPVS